MKKTNLNKLAQAKEVLQKVRELVTAIAVQETDAFDSKSERWQESDAGCEAEEQCDLLNEAVEGLEQACDAIEELV